MVVNNISERKLYYSLVKKTRELTSCLHFDECAALLEVKV